MQDVACYTSPIGTVTITGQDGYIISVDIGGKEQAQDKPLPAYMQHTLQQLEQYFNGTLQQFNVPLRYNTTSEFYRKTWQALAAIPFGETRSYGRVAQEIGHKGAARAVGNACNRNLLPLLIPCHRVVGSNGKMTGFALGIETKEWLLAHEAKVAAGKLAA